MTAFLLTAAVLYGPFALLLAISAVTSAISDRRARPEQVNQ